MERLNVSLTNRNYKTLVVENGNLISMDLTENIKKKFLWYNIVDPFMEKKEKK